MVTLQTQLQFNGNVSVVDVDDEGPLIQLRFFGEATALSEAARLRIGALVKTAFINELEAAGEKK